MNKSVALFLLTTFSFLFGDNNVLVRHGDQQLAHGEFIGTYMNHVHILVGENIYYYACDDIISITYASEGASAVFTKDGRETNGIIIKKDDNHIWMENVDGKTIKLSVDEIEFIQSDRKMYGKGFDYDCSKNTVTADILFPPEFDPMTGEMAQILPDVFNPDIPKPAAKIEAGGISAAENFVIIDGVKYAKVSPEKETAQVESKAGMSVWAILPGQKSAIKSLSRAAGFTNSNLSTYLMKNYGQTLDGLSHTQGTNVINKFQAGSVSKPNPETGTRGTTLSTLEIRSMALMNAGQKHNGAPWGLLGLAGCGSGMMGGIMGVEMADFPGFVIGGIIGLSLPSLFASGATPVPYYPNEIKTQNRKQLYKDAYVKETGRLRVRSTQNGTLFGLVGFGVFMMMIIM